jgi:signal transduction histidine kinase
MELYLETFELSHLIRDVVITIQPMAQKNHNLLEVRMPPAAGFMRADEMRVRQILLNLLSNACKFTQNGVIILAVARELRNGEGWIQFQVQDSGIGMSSEQIRRLFRFFSQAHPPTNHNYGGSGLGLAISQRFCDLMGGVITVESTPANGTTFTVSLPAEVHYVMPEPVTA